MQSKMNSLSESIEGALISAPTAMLLHKGMLMVAQENALNEYQDYFIMISWVFFLLHSIAWRYLVRRIHAVYKVNISPIYLIRRLLKK
jgi:hypothetical protein